MDFSTYLKNIIYHNKSNQKQVTTVAPIIKLDEHKLKDKISNLEFIQVELEKPKNIEIKYGKDGFYLYNGKIQRLKIEEAIDYIISQVIMENKYISLSEEFFEDLLIDASEEKQLVL